MRLATMLLVLPCLVGCAQYDAAREANLTAAAQARVASDDAACRASGAQPGSPVYEDCRQRLENQHANESHSQARVAEQLLNEGAREASGR